MNPFERLKRLYQEAFVMGQEMVAQEQAAKDVMENQSVIQEAAKAAKDTIDLANELAADNDPHKKRLAALIKDYAVGGVEQVTTDRLPAEEGRVIEAGSPFSGDSQSSRARLPDSPKPLPLTPPPPPQPPRRGPGRPRKRPQG